MDICQYCSQPTPSDQWASTKMCRSCKLLRTQQWREKTREELNERRRQEYAANPEKHAERSRKHREANREAIQTSWRQWYERNKEKRAEYNKEYQNRPEARAAIRERSRERYQKDAHVKARRLIQARVAKGTMPAAADCFCTDCGSQAAEYDHYLGYSGRHAEAVQPVCKPCHLKRTSARVSDGIVLE